MFLSFQEIRSHRVAGLTGRHPANPDLESPIALQVPLGVPAEAPVNAFIDE